MDDTDHFDTGYDPGQDDPGYLDVTPSMFDADDPALAGNWQNWVNSWDGQTYNVSCGPASVAQIAEMWYGSEVSDVPLVQWAQYFQSWTNKGMAAESLPALFQQLNIQSQYYQGADLNWMNSQLAQGNGVIAMLDMSEYNYRGTAATGESQGTYHFVVVTQIDEATGDVYISDPYAQNSRDVGATTWGQMKLPRAVFEAAWQDLGNRGVVAYPPR